MLPILYNSDTAKEEFASNGMGFIKNCTECKVIEVRNGIYELRLEMLTNDRLSKSIAAGMFLKARPNAVDVSQIFEIYSLSVTDTKITAKAQHIKYIANGNVIGDTYLPRLAQTPLEVWNSIQPYLELENLFEFSSDITTTAVVTAAKERPIRLGEFFQGSEGSMLDTYGGEFHYNNFNIELLKNRGSETGVALRYGSNISSYQQDSNISTTYSHLLPYAAVRAQDSSNKALENNVIIYQSLIDLNNENLTYQRALAYDFSDYFSNDTAVVSATSGEILNYTGLRMRLLTVANAYVRENLSALTEISVNISIDAEETLESLKDCKLCDIVKVYFEPLNISVKAKIIKTEYDVLREKYSKIEIGAVKKSIADLISGKNIGGA